MAEDSLVKLWRKRIEIAIKKRDAHFKNWADHFIAAYRGKVDKNLFTGEQYEKFSNYIFSIEESIEGSSYYRNPEITAESQNPDYEDNESVVAGILNKLYSKEVLGMQGTNRKIRLDARLCGYGVGMARNEFKYDEVIEDEPVPDSTFIGGIKDNVKKLLGREEPKKEGNRQIIPKEDNMRYDRLSPKEVLFDWTQEFGMHDWCVRIRHEKASYVQTSEEFDENAKRITRWDVGGIQDVVGEKHIDAYKNEPDFRYKTLYEIHDLKTKRILILPQAEDFFIRDTEYPYELPRGMLNVLWYADDPGPDGFYPLIPVANYYNEAMEMNYMMTKLEEWVDISRPRYGINVNALSEKQSKVNFERGKMGSLISFKDSVMGNFQKFGGESIGQDFHQWFNISKDNLHTQSGKTEYDMGQPQKGRTATESVYIQEGSKARPFRAEQQFYDFLVEQIRTIHAIAQKELSRSFYIKVRGEEGLSWYKETQGEEEKPVAVSKDRLQGEYVFKFDLSTILRPDPIVEREQDLKLAEYLINPMLRQALREEGKRTLISDFSEKILKKFGHHGRIIVDVDVMSQEQENMIMLQTGQYLPPNPDEDHQEHLKVMEQFLSSPMFAYLKSKAESEEDPEAQARIAGGLQGIVVHQEQTYALHKEMEAVKVKPLQTEIERPSEMMRKMM